jgi:cytochrome c peroxidase
MKRTIIAVTMLWLCASVVAAPPDGKALYQENCASCHGQNGKGDTGPKLVGDASEWKTKLFERAVLNGVDDQGKSGSFENSVGNAAQRACALNAAKLSFPAMRNKTVRMVSKRAYPRALRFAA